MAEQDEGKERKTSNEPNIFRWKKEPAVNYFFATKYFL